MVVLIYESLLVFVDNKEDYYLQLKDLAFAQSIDENKVKIKSGKYKDKILNLLNNDYKENNLICYKTNYEFEENEYQKLEEELNNIMKNIEFQKLVTDQEKILLQPVFDKREKNIVKNNFSLKEKRKEIFDSILQNQGSSFVLDADQKSILLENVDINLQEEIIDHPKPKYDLNQIYNMSKKIIVGQDEPLKMLLSNIMFNMNISNFFNNLDEIADVKKTILLCGSTGTGKTLMIKTIANALNIPYVIEDASRYTATGYYGASTDDLLINLISSIPKQSTSSQAKKDAIVEAQKGIIFIDEIDKICHLKDKQSHVGTTDVQESLLKMIEGTIIRLKIREHFVDETFEFDTRNLTFVLSGAFQDIMTEEIPSENQLMEYGMIRELIGRISPIIKLKTPTKEDLKYAIYNSERSYLKEIMNYFNSIGIECNYNEEYVNYIVDLAFSLNDGYRGLKKAIDMDVNNNLFDLMAGNQKRLELMKKNI